MRFPPGRLLHPGGAVLQLAGRQRSARVQILQEVLDRMRQEIVARSFQYADEPVGVTGMMVKDCRGKNGQKAVWIYCALVPQINDVLKQVAIESGQWAEERIAPRSAAPRDHRVRKRQPRPRCEW